MALTKTTEIGKIEVVGEHKHIQIRTDTIIKEDGVELSRTHSRKAISCWYADDNLNGSVTYREHDLSGEDDEVKAIANTVWTDTVKASYKKWLEDNPRP
jgi:hypothetical protein